MARLGNSKEAGVVGVQWTRERVIGNKVKNRNEETGWILEDGGQQTVASWAKSVLPPAFVNQVEWEQR